MNTRRAPHPQKSPKRLMMAAKIEKKKRKQKKTMPATNAQTVYSHTG